MMNSRVLRCNQLLKKIQRGDEKALDTLFIEFGALFLNMAKKYLFDDRYAEDLLSEVFLELLSTGARSFDQNKNGLNWFFVIIKNKAYKYNGRYDKDFLRLDEMESNKSLVEYICTSCDNDRSVDNIVIVDSLKKLSEYENLLLYYKYWENLTVREIANKLDKPKSTIHSDINKVLSKLKKLLGENK